MNKRRSLVIAMGASALASPLSLFAQPKKLARVGILGNMSAADVLVESFTAGLRELGYIEGTNLAIERRFGEGDETRLDALAADLVKLKPDVIFAPNSIAVEAGLFYLQLVIQVDVIQVHQRQQGRIAACTGQMRGQVS